MYDDPYVSGNTSVSQRVGGVGLSFKSKRQLQKELRDSIIATNESQDVQGHVFDHLEGLEEAAAKGPQDLDRSSDEELQAEEPISPSPKDDESDNNSESPVGDQIEETAGLSKALATQKIDS